MAEEPGPTGTGAGRVENPMASVATGAAEDAASGQQLASEFLASMTAAELEEHIGNIAKKKMAYAGEAPTNLHQVTTWKVTSKDTAPATKAAWLACSFALFFAQLLVITSVTQAVTRPSCVRNSQCQAFAAGTYCTPNVRFEGAEALPTCAYCGEVHWYLTEHGNNSAHMFEDARGDLQSFAEHPGQLLPVDFVDNYTVNEAACQGQQEHSVCAACYNPATRSFSRQTREALSYNNLMAMSFGDYMALLLASWFCALAIAMEVRDILLCRTLRRAAAAREDPASVAWRFPLAALEFLRRFAMLPTLTFTIFDLVTIRGADALQICFNALAILFLLEVDNYAYRFAIPEATRSAAEQFGRADLDSGTQKQISRTKTIYTILLSIFVPLSLLPPSITCPDCKRCDAVDYHSNECDMDVHVTARWLIQLVGFLLAAEAEAALDGKTLQAKLINCAVTLPKWLFGFICQFMAMEFIRGMNG